MVRDEPQLGRPAVETTAAIGDAAVSVLVVGSVPVFVSVSTVTATVSWGLRWELAAEIATSHISARLLLLLALTAEAGALPESSPETFARSARC